MVSGVKANMRMIHVTFQTLGVCFILLGMAFVVTNKILKGKTVIPHTVHSILGTLALVGVVTQMVVGRLKIGHSLPSAKRKYIWHGKLGLLTYDIGMLSMITGLLWWTVTPMSIVLVFLLVGIWIAVSMKFASTTDLPDVVHVPGIQEIELMESAPNSSHLPTPRKTPPRHPMLTNKMFIDSDYFDDER